MGDDSGTGVAFTRNPSTGENKFYGEFLINAQGEDVVAGIRTPQPVAEMPKWNKKCLQPAARHQGQARRALQGHAGHRVHDREGKLFMLQTRTGKRTGAAAVKIACDMVKEKLIDEKTAVQRIPADDLTQLLLPSFSPAAKKAAEVLTDRPARFARRGGRQAGVHRGRSGRAHRTPARRCCWSARKPAPKTSTACTRRPASSPAPAA